MGKHLCKTCDSMGAMYVISCSECGNDSYYKDNVSVHSLNTVECKKCDEVIINAIAEIADCPECGGDGLIN